MTARNRAIRRRRSLGLFVFVTLAAAALAAPAAAQMRMAAGGESPAVDSATKAAIVDSVSTALLEAYVLEDVAKDMAEEIRRNLRRGDYDEHADIAAFTAALTEDLRGVSNDRHLRVMYASPELIAQFQQEDDDPEAAFEREYASLAKVNFQFRELKVMDGNVGYLKLDGFTDTSFSGPTAVAAMNFLAHCDALIIDLRDNGGGYPSLIQTLLTYLLPEQTHLNSFYTRKDDSLHQFWSLPYVPGPSMKDVDLYVLTSGYTFSGAEEFTYNVKNLERGTIVGEVTGGGAHPVRFKALPGLNVAMALPYGRAINPVSGTNWEGTGVTPDIEVPRADALDVAYKEALKKILADKEAAGEDTFAMRWIIDGIEASMHPYEVDASTLRPYAGRYGPRRLWMDGDALYYQRDEGAVHKLIPMSERLFRFGSMDGFRLEIVVNEDGNATGLVGHYDNGRTDESPRTGD